MDTEKILVRGVNWLGDAIMTLPALQRLRDARPKARITLLTPEKLAGLWEGQPVIDSVLAFGASDSLLQTAKRLRAEQFDVAVAFPNSFRSALELWRAGIPKRIGVRRGLRGLFLTDALPPRPGSIPMKKRSDTDVGVCIAAGLPGAPIPPEAHHILDYLYLTARLGSSVEPLPPKLFVPPDNVTAASVKFGVGANDLWLGLNPGAEYGAAKRWPVERFIETATALCAATSCRWLIFGGANDSTLTEKVARAIEAAAGEKTAINLAGKTSLSESAALFTRCRAVLTNDTGPMHLADAVGARVIVPFGSTSPEMTGPVFSGRAKILRSPPPCAPCFRRSCPIDLRCLTAITAPQVVDAVRQALATF